jgi:hypothetical protein
MGSEGREKIENWIKEKLKEGVEPSVIKEVLKEKGYDPNIVDEILKPSENQGKLEGIKASEKSNQPSKVLILMAFILGIIAVGGFLFIYFLKFSNQELTRQGWKFVRFEVINDTTFKIVGTIPFKSYIIEKENEGKFFIIYPEVRFKEMSWEGYAWVKEFDLNVLENLTVETKFDKESFTPSLFFMFILIRNDNQYSYNRFSFMSNITNCKDEDNFIKCKDILNFSDLCETFKNYRPIDCPVSGIHKFYFYFLTLDKKVFVKQVKFYDKVLLDL